MSSSFLGVEAIPFRVVCFSRDVTQIMKVTLTKSGAGLLPSSSSSSSFLFFHHLLPPALTAAPRARGRQRCVRAFIHEHREPSLAVSPIYQSLSAVEKKSTAGAIALFSAQQSRRSRMFVEIDGALRAQGIVVGASEYRRAPLISQTRVWRMSGGEPRSNRRCCQTEKARSRPRSRLRYVHARATLTPANHCQALWFVQAFVGENSCRRRRIHTPTENSIFHERRVDAADRLPLTLTSPPSLTSRPLLMQGTSVQCSIRRRWYLPTTLSFTPTCATRYRHGSEGCAAAR